MLTIDVRGLGISGFQAGEWLRANCHVDIGSADACRISARLSYADDDENERRLLESLGSLVEAAGSIERPPGVSFPSEKGLELESVMLPRDAFFGRVEQVPVAEAAGRISAETVSPYPPGVPVLAPRGADQPGGAGLPDHRSGGRHDRPGRRGRVHGERPGGRRVAVPQRGGAVGA